MREEVRKGEENKKQNTKTKSISQKIKTACETSTRLDTERKENGEQESEMREEVKKGEKNKCSTQKTRK